MDSKDSIFEDSLTFEGYDRALPPWEPDVEADEDWLLVFKIQDLDPEIDPHCETLSKVLSHCNNHLIQVKEERIRQL